MSQIDTTVIVLFVQEPDAQRRASHVDQIKKIATKHSSAGYEADFCGLPTVHMHDDFGHSQDWEKEGYKH